MFRLTPSARVRREMRKRSAWKDDDPRHPRRVSCPACGAAVGEPCDRRTLGRHLFHQARVAAAAELDA